jgi:hypothetical protein
MKKLALLSTFFLLNNVAASGTLQSNFLEIGITNLNYVKPSDNKQIAGALVFTEAKMSRSDMSFNMVNKDNVFNSEINFQEGNLSFDSNYMSLSFDMGEESEFNNIKKMKFKDSYAVINPTFFTLSGNLTSFTQPDVYLSLNNYFIYCTANDPDFDMASAEGIEKGCMTEFSLAANNGNEKSEIEMIMDYEDGDQMTMLADIEEVNLVGESMINFSANKVNMSVSGYDVETRRVEGTCYKNPHDKTFDTEKIMKDCENSVDITVPKILMEDNKEDTKFFIQTDFLKTADERLLLKAPAIQFIDKESSVTTVDLGLDCQKSEDVEISDLHGIIGECLNEGEINISKIISKDEKDLWYRYSKVLDSNFDPTAGARKKDISAKNINISLDKNKMILRGNVFGGLLGAHMKFNVFMTGNVVHTPEREQLIIYIQKIEVPVGWIKLKWKKFFMGILKKALVGESIDIIDDKIIIQL